MTRSLEMVRVAGLGKRYGKRLALDNVNFSLGAGEIVALLGPNGAGKTTTFKCLLGVIGFTGEVFVNGTSVRREGKTARRQMGYLPQNQVFDPQDTCDTALRFLAELKGVGPERAEALLKRVHLADQHRVRVGHLSGGMRQRLALAAALLSDPPLLLLDEPTANLDAENRREFNELLLELRREGRTILLSTHFVETLSEIADRVIVLREGRTELDVTMQELRRAKLGRRFVVNVNGTDPAVLLDALGRIGIAAERVSQVHAHLEEMLAAAISERQERQ